MLQTVSSDMMKRKTRYSPPANVGSISLASLLVRSGRNKIDDSQMTFLERNSAKDASGGVTMFYAGDLELVAQPAIAVIGTRKVTEEGRKRANRFARELVEAGVVVVSGLAAGVDGQALTSAMRAGGRVIAVIGTPIDNAYPAENAALQEDIYEHHLLLSQFEKGSRTFPSNFPARNRTMAAISDASVIIEASESSGTLHQAAECVRLGRWLGISKAVVEDTKLKWPNRFLGYERCIVLESTTDFVRRIYDR